MRGLLFIVGLFSIGPSVFAQPSSPALLEHEPLLVWHAVEDDNGGFFLLWTRQDAGAVRLMAQHIGMDGVPVWPEAGLSFLPAMGDTTSWTAFADSRHGVAVAWVQDGKTRVQRWTPDGQPVWRTAVQLSDNRFQSTSPAGVADGAGGVFVVWSEKSFAERSVLMAQHLNAQSVPLWMPSAVRVSLRPSDQREPAVAYDGASGVIVSWADYRDIESDWRVQRMNYQGFRLWGLEGMQVTAPAGTGSSGLHIAPWGQGSLTAVWCDGLRGHGQVRQQRFTPQGQPVADLRPAPPPSASDQWNPVLIGNGEGRVWTGWEDNRNGHNWQIFIRQDQDGDDLALAPSIADQGRLALADDGYQGVFAVWLENRRGAPGIYAQHLDGDGKAARDGAGETLVEGLTHPSAPQLVALSPGHVALIWADRSDATTWRVGWRILTADAVLVK